MVALNHAEMPAYIAGQAGMRGGMDIPGAHSIAGLEFRGRDRRTAELAAHHDTLDVIGQTPDDVRTLLIVGHNPAAQQVASSLTGRGDLALPTTAIAVIDLGSWARLDPGAGSAHAFWTPRSAGS